MKAKMLGLVAAGLLVVPLAANAVTTYTDRATWQAAAGGGTGDIAEDFSAAPENWLPYDADGFAIS